MSKDKMSLAQAMGITRTVIRPREESDIQLREDRIGKYFKKYLDSGEADSYELMNMGQAQMDNGNYDTAITYFQNALELESVPNKQQITKAMIIAYEYSGDFATAKSKMEEYMKDYPDDEDAAREYQFLETR